MPTFSRSLEQSLHRALALANERHHEYATLEHLLLALIDDQDAAAVMRACNVDTGEAQAQSRLAIWNPSWKIWSPTAARTASPPPASSA